MIERKIIIGLITSTEFISKVKPFWDNQFLESVTAKRIAGWCMEYYDKYQKAPNKEIEGIFYSKIKDIKFPKDIAEEIEQEILPGLSKEYAREDFNLEFLLTETKKHFNERKLSILSDSVKVLVKSGKPQDAQKLIQEYSPLPDSLVTLNDFIRSTAQIRREKKEPPITFIKSWLKAGQTTIIYGNYGSGKSLLTILISYIVGLKKYDAFEGIGDEWIVRNPTGCLYIDGELGELEMDERIRQFEWIGRQSIDHRIKVLSVPEYQLATENSFYLSLRENQLQITQWLKNNPTYKLIVLDSASTLFGLIEENDNSEWSNKVNPFLRDLRALGVACIMLHHSGKNEKKGLRGASAMGAMAHNIFRITDHGDKEVDDGEAWFVLTKDKQRSGGKSFKTLALHFTQTTNENETHWEVTELYSKK